jgi:ABC-type multidrug transport system ATPase subunit
MKNVEERGTMNASPPMLRISGLNKAFGRAHVLHDLSLIVEAGSVVALLGANGAGKTTTLKCILGVMPFEGEIEVGGTSVRKSGKEARRQIGYVPQAPPLSERDTCREVLSFLAELKRAPKERVDAMLELVNLAPQRDVRVGHLSGGMRQRLALAAALLADPPLLLLDEPTASLDVESRQEFHKLIARLREEGKTIILSTHFLAQLDQLAARAVILDQGRVAFDGTLGELAGRAHARRFVVSLNGNSAQVVEALRAAGLDPSELNPEPADMRWEDLLGSLPRHEALPAAEESP